MTRPIRRLVQLAFPTSIFFFTSASSCGAGDRAFNGGVCPEGEVCDPVTEDGLHFEGVTFTEGFDSGGVKTTAVGGIQAVGLFDVDDTGRLIALKLDYEAAVDSGAAVVESKRDNDIRLRGTADAEGFLRVTSPTTGELFDRIRIAARTIDTVRVEPSFNIALDGDSTTNLYAPGARGFIRLVGQDIPLVDQNAVISGAGITQRRWDRFEVGDLAVGPHTLDVTAGDRGTLPVAFEIAHADSLRHLFGKDVTRHSTGFVCFTARSGTRGINVAWTFEADNATVDNHQLAGCVVVTHTGGDSVTLRAFADGLETSIDLPVVDADRARPAAKFEAFAAARGLITVIGDTAGDRAAME